MPSDTDLRRRRLSKQLLARETRRLETEHRVPGRRAETRRRAHRRRFPAGEQLVTLSRRGTAGGGRRGVSR